MTHIWQSALSWIIAQQRILKFLAIGGSLYVLSAILMFLFKENMQLNENMANLFQTLITYTLQFVLNALITWADRSATPVQNFKRIARYIPAKVVLWIVNQMVFAFWMMGDIHYQFANALTVLVIMAVNYIVFDRLIFTTH